MKRKTSRKNERRGPVPGPASSSSAVPAGDLPVGRKWLFRVGALFVLPLLMLGGLEIVLRLMGVGFDPHFFRRQAIGGKECYVVNENFGLRFFPRGLARIPTPAIMPATKAPGTFRIFIFGESAALGEPTPNYGAGRYLEVLLAERFPQAKFEVINTSMTAINSHAILPIARECAGHDGDLWIIYMGNNEMVGPFGMATVFGVRAPPIWLLRMKLQLQRLRLVQLVLELGENLHKGKSASPSWLGMEMFMQSQVSPKDPRKQKVYQNFRRNLEDILKAGRDSGAKIILSTVAVNLKDCPPFGSLSGDDLPEATRATWSKLRQDGAAAETQGRFADAQSDFQRAAEMYPESAEVQFQLATCLMRLTNATAAQPHFLRAVDNDTLPFRTDSIMNDTIRAVAHQFAGDSLTLYDAAEVLGKGSPPGEEMFYEHVHFNPDGNYALAVAWAEQVEKQLEPALKRGARSAWASQAECEQLIGLTDWNRVSTLQVILERIQRPPFTGQSGNVQQAARLQNEIAELRKRRTSEAAARAREVYLLSLRRSPENFRLHENYAEFLEAEHDFQAAVAERRKVCELISYHYFPYYALGVDLKEAGELTDARDALLKAVALRPEQAEVRLELGVVYARQHDWEAARQALEVARRFNPDNPQVPLFLGEVLWKLERRGEALAALRDAVRLAPSDWQPHYRLASDLAQEGNLSGAVTEYQEALRLNPGNVRTKVSLAAVLLNLSRKDEALQQLDESLQLDPTNQAVLELRQKVRSM